MERVKKRWNRKREVTKDIEQKGYKDTGIDIYGKRENSERKRDRLQKRRKMCIS